MSVTPAPIPTRAALLAQLLPLARQAQTMTYQALAARLALAPPLTIHRVVLALEALTLEDVAQARAPLAAVVVSRHRGGIPAPGFFDQLQRLGCLAPEQGGEESRASLHRRLLREVQAQARSDAWQGVE
jgi:hypothetical protein